MLQLLVSTITRHLGSQQKLYELAQHGMRLLLVQLCASMHKAVKLLVEESREAPLGKVHLGLGEHFGILAAAGMPCSTLSWQCQRLHGMLCLSTFHTQSLPDTACHVLCGLMGQMNNNSRRSTCLGKQNHEQRKP